MRRNAKVKGWSKLWIAPQSFKSCRNTTNNIIALSPSGPVIARRAAQFYFETKSSARQSNPILWSTVPKTLFWIMPQTFKRVVIHVRMKIHSFPNLRSRTVFVLPFYTGLRGPRSIYAMTEFWIGTAYPGLFKFYPCRVVTTEGF